MLLLGTLMYIGLIICISAKEGMFVVFKGVQCVGYPITSPQKPQLLHAIPNYGAFFCYVRRFTCILVFHSLPRLHPSAVQT